jgi:hypothetical protein
MFHRVTLLLPQRIPAICWVRRDEQSTGSNQLPNNDFLVGLPTRLALSFPIAAPQIHPLMISATAARQLSQEDCHLQSVIFIPTTGSAGSALTNENRDFPDYPAL